MALRDIVSRIKTLARKNPDAVRRTIDTVQDQVDRRTGGRYRQHVEKVGDTLETQLGVRQTRPQDPQQDQDPQQTREPQQAPDPQRDRQTPDAGVDRPDGPKEERGM